MALLELQGHLLPAAASLGVSAHVFLFRHGEWDTWAFRIILVHLAALLVTFGTAHYSMVDQPVTLTSSIATAYLFGLYGSMLVYRAFFHRLGSFPGPAMAKLSNLYITFLSGRRLQLFRELESLHAKYGDYVRTGPTELFIIAPGAVQAIYGSTSPTTKGIWNTHVEPFVSLQLTRDKKEHARQRKIWDKGFTTQALNGYAPRVQKAVDLFLIAVEKHLDKPMEMARWTAYFAFDVTEDLAFNKTSNMLRDGTDSYIFTKIRDDMRNLGITSRLPWLTNIIISTPILNRDFWSFWEWVQSRLDVRIKNEPEIPDIFSWILDEFNKGSKTQKDIYKLRANSQLIVVAGSDTASATLTHVFFWLAWDPELRARLQAELDALPDLSNEHLTHASLLNAIISETLRLNPPVISGTQRQTPPEGLRIGDRHIPGNVLVNVPNYVICRDARYFDKPTEFIPERWTTRPELNRDPSVYIPFNIGPYGCIGKRLAMMKIRMLLAQLLARYDLRMAPGETKEKFFESALDTFTLIPGELPVIWTKRSEPGSMEQAKK